jgi:hypothetical protein
MSSVSGARLRRELGDLASVVGVVLLYGVLLLVVHRTGLTRLLVHSGDGYQTLMQVLPATVIGIYALAFGSIFVAAQLVAPARGSRSLLLLLLERRFRTMVVATLLVAVGSVLLAGQAPQPPAGLDPWVASAAAALAVLTVLVMICFTLVLVELFGCYNSPRSFGERLRDLSLSGKRQLPPVISALRQWLCTAARGGQTRDLYYACQAARQLVVAYQKYAEIDPGYRTAAPIGRWEPEAGWQSPGNRRSGLDALMLAALTPADPAQTLEVTSPWHRDPEPTTESWFAEQLSTALVRATEEATRADIAWRGLDELLCTQQDLLRWALAIGLDPEVRRFHRGLVETCALGEQAESVRTTTWFIRAKEDLRVIDGLLAERRPDLLAAPAR